MFAGTVEVIPQIADFPPSLAYDTTPLDVTVELMEPLEINAYDTTPLIVENGS